MATENAAAKIKKGGRSPNYPSVDLKRAIELAKVIQDEGKGHPVPIAVVHEKWGNTAHGSVSNQAVAALRAYGLIEIEGKGTTRKLSVSNNCLRILESAPDREKLIRKAAVAPPIHGELWEKYKAKGLPSDSTIAEYLRWERPSGAFHKDAIGGVVGRFRSTIGFANLEESGIIEGGQGGGDGAPGPIKVGDNVQWTSDDKAQWKPPRKVLEIVTHDDGPFVRVEAGDDDEGGHVPLSEVEKVDTPTATESLNLLTPPAGGASDPWSAKDGTRLKFPFGNDNELTIIMRKKVSRYEFDKTVKAVFDLSSAAFIDYRLQDGPESDTVDDGDAKG